MISQIAFLPCKNYEGLIEQELHSGPKIIIYLNIFLHKYLKLLGYNFFYFQYFLFYLNNYNYWVI